MKITIFVFVLKLLQGLRHCCREPYQFLCHLSLQSLYDKHLGAEFQSEVRTLAQVEHLSLVKFYGFLQQDEERIIVVEYVRNGTLREHLDCEFFL